jgi:hypothetical protein
MTELLNVETARKASHTPPGTNFYNSDPLGNYLGDDFFGLTPYQVVQVNDVSFGGSESHTQSPLRVKSRKSSSNLKPTSPTRCSGQPHISSFCKFEKHNFSNQSWVWKSRNSPPPGRTLHFWRPRKKGGLAFLPILANIGDVRDFREGMSAALD